MSLEEFIGRAYPGIDLSTVEGLQHLNGDNEAESGKMVHTKRKGDLEALHRENHKDVLGQFASLAIAQQRRADKFDGRLSELELMVKGVHRMMKEMQASQQQAVALLKSDGGTNGHGRQHSSSNGQNHTPGRSSSQHKREQSASPRTDGSREPSRGRPPAREKSRRDVGRGSRRHSSGGNHDGQEAAADTLGA